MKPDLLRISLYILFFLFWLFSTPLHFIPFHTIQYDDCIMYISRRQAWEMLTSKFNDADISNDIDYIKVNSLKCLYSNIVADQHFIETAFLSLLLSIYLYIYRYLAHSFTLFAILLLGSELRDKSLNCVVFVHFIWSQPPYKLNTKTRCQT